MFVGNTRLHIALNINLRSTDIYTLAGKKCVSAFEFILFAPCILGKAALRHINRCFICGNSVVDGNIAAFIVKFDITGICFNNAVYNYVACNISDKTVIYRVIMVI